MTLPKIGVNMTEAIIDEWFVKPGDVIEKGDAILLAETDKATQEIFATESGVVEKLLAEQGDNIEIHQPILSLIDDGEENPAEENLAKDAMQEEQVAPVKRADGKENVILAKSQTPQAIKSTGGERVKISPLAKKLAKEKEIDISELKPSAPGKRIVKNDVLNFTPPVSQTTAMRQSTMLSIDEQDVLETIPLSGVRKVIANRMSESNLEKPCAALTLTVIADEIVRVREMFKEHDIKVSYNDIITKIVAQSLCKHRNINAVLNGDSIQMLKHVNIGIAVDSERGLVVPVIKDADKKSIRQIAQDFSEKVTAIRENTISGEDLTGGTFTITNLGMFEIEEFTPIINPPECCILAVGAMKKVFVPDEQERPKLVTEMKLTLVFDHRIVDGAPAAKFLQCVKHYIECPEFLL